MNCPKCNGVLIRLYGSQESVCENCGETSKIRFSKSGTRYAITGVTAPEVITTPKSLKDSFTPQNREEIRHREMVVEAILSDMLGYRSPNIMRTLTFETVKEALAQAYEQGKKRR